MFSKSMSIARYSDVIMGTCDLRNLESLVCFRSKQNSIPWKRWLYAICALTLAGCSPQTPEAPVQPDTSAALVWRDLPTGNDSLPQYRAWFDFVRLGESRARLQNTDTVFDIFPAGNYYPEPLLEGEGMHLFVPRAFARPGERWVEIFVELEEELMASGQPVLDVRLFSPASEEPVESTRFVPTSACGLLLADLRSPSLAAGRLVVELSIDGVSKSRGEVFLAAQDPEQPLVDGDRIRVTIDSLVGDASNRPVAVTFGVPFPAGTLWQTDRLRVVQPDGKAVPFQTEVLGRWAPEGSIQWVRFDALAGSEEELFVEIGEPGSATSPPIPLRIGDHNGKIVVDTGAAVYQLAPGPSPISGILLDGREAATSEGARGLYMIDQNGRLATSTTKQEQIQIEASGPVAACVRFEGAYRTVEGEELARHITRIEFFAGRRDAKITHTLVLSRDSNEVWFREAGWEFAVVPGADPVAVFGVSREEPHESLQQALSDSSGDSAYILQDEHLRFAKGNNRFEVGFETGPGERTLLLEGEEMGDWAALAGNAGGLAAAVRDAALQHPKEFLISGDRFNLLLFSNRAGEELDFRSETLVKKWNLPGEYDGIRVRETIANLESNAIGWSKTHTMALTPLSGEQEPVAQGALLAMQLTNPDYAHVDPWWIYRSEAMGPLHPRDPDRFGVAEQGIETMLEGFRRNLRGQSFFGFVDYNAGPTFSSRGASGDLVRERRFSSTYQLRPDLWGVYARSGERWIRDFAEQTNRAAADNYLAHWSGPGKVRGLFVEAKNITSTKGGAFMGSGDFPFYWQDGTSFNKQDNTSLQHILFDYYLTGNRRSGELIRQFAEGMKQAWEPVAVTKRKRKVMTFRALLHAYQLTHDPDLRPLVEATISYVYDPEGVTGLTKNKELGATYKARCAVRALIEGWNTFGTPQYYDMARRMSEHKWNRYLGTSPNAGTTSPFGIVGNFLYRETLSPLYPKWLEVSLAWAQLEEFRASTHQSAYAMSGIPATLDVLAQVPKEDMERISWVVCTDDPTRPVSFVVKKGAYDHLDIYRNTRASASAEPGEWVRALSPAELRSRDRSLISLQTTSNLAPGSHGHVATRVKIPKEAPGEVFEILPLEHGQHFVAAIATRPEILQLDPPGRGWTLPYEWSGRAPMVLAAPLGWKTHPAPARVFFRIPENSQKPKIFFGSPTLLMTPQGNPFREGEELTGWIELPADQPGLWSFLSGGDSRLVEVQNVPSFFAFEHPESYFVPPSESVSSQTLE